jgi:hypothetical protein
MKHDERHGSPFDRGGADFYYRRGFVPHYYTGATYMSDRIERDAMTAAEIAAYAAGYEAAEAAGDQKDYE